MTIEPISPAHNDFRSDTFTTPTQAMMEAVFSATVGDSVYKEDRSTLDLEEKLCKMTGKEAALFCVSGTLSNQIALRTHLLQPPHSILCDYRAHVYTHEAGGLATLSQAMVTPAHPRNGDYITLEDVIDNFIHDDGDIHSAPTKVISLENTLHGIITPIEEIERISVWCRERKIKLHCDGARLWNAAAETGVSLEKYGSLFDSISLCLSKSIGAPIGSVLVGEKRFIEKANHFKKQNGGGIRQAGMITSMASIAIDQNFSKLRGSHELAKNLGDFCKSHNIKLQSPVDTNFVFIDTAAMDMDEGLLIKIGEKHNVKLMGSRIAFHYQTSEDSLERVKSAILECHKDSLVNPVPYVGPPRLYSR